MPQLVAGVVADAPAVDGQDLVGYWVNAGNVGDVGAAAGITFYRLYQRTEILLKAIWQSSSKSCS